MEVTSSTASSSAASTTAQNDTEDGVVSSDFETFLRMLTTQMENQDPLNPMESSEFAMQLATFSGVEQQVRTNDLLGALSDQFGLNGVGQYAGWVGMEARVAAPVAFDGSPVTIFPTPDEGADRAVLVVRDEAGDVVQSEEIALTGDPLTWAGVGEGGIPLDNGLYTFTVDSHAGGELISSTIAESYATVSEVRAGTDKPVLVLQGGAEVSAETVTALRDPATS